MGRIDNLLGTMTLEEKIGQLNMAAAAGVVTGPGEHRVVEEDIRAGRVGSVLNVWGGPQVHALQRLAVEDSRLGIPLLCGLDVVHGHHTIFPVPLAEACLFDPDTWERTARAAAAEAAQDGIALTFAPMVDVARDPRWGRMVESPGEDPWIAAQFAVAKTRGFQGRALSAAAALAATAKHLGAYGAVTAGREYASVDVAERTLHEVYLPPFAAAVAAGVAAIMPAFTDLAGVPASADTALLQSWLRGGLAFDGVVISDYNAVAELCNHGVAHDIPEAAALALRAGVDIDMASGSYTRGLAEALGRGLITQADIDASVRRVLRLKERLGLLADPYRRGADAPGARGTGARGTGARGTGARGTGARSAGTRGTAAARALAREVARRAIVLLCHRGHVLPIAGDVTHLAVIGPLAAAAGEMLGPWSSAGRAEDTVSILQGLEAALPRCRIDHRVGVDVGGEDTSGIAEAIECCRGAELIILCLGETASMSGEAASRAELGLPGAQCALAEAALDLGKPLVVLLSSGRPLTVPWLFERAHAVLATWFLGSEAGNAIADVLTGNASPSGKLPVSWPRHGGQVPIFYSQRASGRPTSGGDRFTSSYLDVPATPQYPFGHGLSYADFTLHELDCAPQRVRAGDSVEVSVSVHNESSIAGETTLFLFVRDVVATIARPVLELKGVRRVSLGPGEHARVTWPLPAGTLAYLGPGLDTVLEPGWFEIHVGQSADPAQFLSSRIQLLG
jgi:beta-glucosidase